MADFINRVTEHFDELTKSHKEVANYFLYNLDKVAVGTLEDLAGLVGVSLATPDLRSFRRMRRILY